MIILQQVYLCLRHSLQNEISGKKKTENKETARPPIKFFAMLVETETFFSEA